MKRRKKLVAELRREHLANAQEHSDVKKLGEVDYYKNHFFVDHFPCAVCDLIEEEEER